jgi:DeoD family purine-nucleoside phosphorylase
MSPSQTIHLHPTAELAERVLLPGDPGRALALAQLLLEKPLMFNHHRGLWGYTGRASDGELLTVQSTGMGGPSAAIVLHELIELGVRRAIRVGTCGALDPALGLGDLVVAREAIAADGTSRALTDAATGGLTRADTQMRIRAHETLTRRLGQVVAGYERKTQPDATIVSTDLFYEPGAGRNEKWHEEGAVAVEMETAALFAVAAQAGIHTGCVLTVSDTFDASGQRARIGDQELVEAAESMGRAAVAAMSD